MNLAQIRADVRDKLTAGGGVNTVITTDTFWANGEIDSYINMAQDELYKVIRRARSDYFTRILRTTDSALSIAGQLFLPSSLKLVVNQGNYQLPPDFVRMKLITDLSDDRVRFTAADIARNEFRGLMASESSSVSREYLYDILGIRTLLLRPFPFDARDLEFVYEKRLPRLKDTTTGTVTVTNGSTVVTFSSENVTNKLSPGFELIVSSSATAPTIDPNETYPTIKSIDSATQATLEAVFTGPSGVNAFVVSPVSEIPEHHHGLLVALATVFAFKKGTNPHSDSVKEWMDVFNFMLPNLIADVEIRQGSDSETVSPYLEGEYD